LEEPGRFSGIEDGIEEGWRVFCGLAHTVMNRWISLEAACKAPCLPLLSIMIRSGECWAGEL